MRARPPQRANLFRSGDLLHSPLASLLGPLDLDGVDTLELASLFVLDKVSGRDAVLSRVISPMSDDFGMTVIRSFNTGKGRPRIVGGSRSRRLGK